MDLDSRAPAAAASQRASGLLESRSPSRQLGVLLRRALKTIADSSVSHVRSGPVSSCLPTGGEENTTRPSLIYGSCSALCFLPFRPIACVPAAQPRPETQGRRWPLAGRRRVALPTAAARRPRCRASSTHSSTPTRRARTPRRRPTARRSASARTPAAARASCAPASTASTPSPVSGRARCNPAAFVPVRLLYC